MALFQSGFELMSLVAVTTKGLGSGPPYEAMLVSEGPATAGAMQLWVGYAATCCHDDVWA